MKIGSSNLERDPREAKLPQWVQDKLNGLRGRVAWSDDRVREAQGVAQHLVEGTTPAETDTVYFLDDREVGLPAQQPVRFKILAGYLDVQIVDGGLEVTASRGQIVIAPRFQNTVIIRIAP